MAPRISSEAGGKPCLPQAETAESAGCDALRAEQSADGILGLARVRGARPNQALDEVSAAVLDISLHQTI